MVIMFLAPKIFEKTGRTSVFDVLYIKLKCISNLTL